MSRGSTFVILRKERNPNKITEEQFGEYCKNWYTDWKGNPSDIKDIPELICYNDTSYVNKNSLELLTKLVEATFTSDFAVLIDYYNLSYYADAGRKDRVILSPETARNMLQAVKYLLSEEYSKSTEELLDNKWIEVFSTDWSPYLEWKHKEEFSEDEWAQYRMKRLKQIFETYLFINSESDEEIILLYYAWG